MAVGGKKSEIGEREDCYLFSNSIFQCNDGKGDLMKLLLIKAH